MESLEQEKLYLPRSVFWLASIVVVNSSCRLESSMISALSMILQIMHCFSTLYFSKSIYLGGDYLKLPLQAVANSTSATFLRVVGSELIQKYLGDGPKLVRELFRVADELSPSIVFIDEIDAVGTKRYDAHSGGEREIQRTMLELLNQLDGFDSRGDVKVILATNRIESLDPALLRPGRIDRKIEFPLPDIKTRRRIFQVLYLLQMISFTLLE
jgi:hypothetical protein